MSKAYTVARVAVGGMALATSAVGLAQAQDLAGMYAGASLGVHGGTFQSFGDEYTVPSTSAAGAFFGYNAVSGNLVYGGEIAWSNGGDVGTYGVSGVSNLFDVRGRVGAMLGSTFVYGALGYSHGALVGPGVSNGSVSGPSIGAGFEMPFGSNGFVGGDLTTRLMDGSGTVYGSPASDYVHDVKLTTASVRLGFRF